MWVRPHFVFRLYLSTKSVHIPIDESMPQVKPEIETFAKIKVVGVGGSGNSAINRMISARIKGVDFVAINTDIQALHHSLAPQKLQIGRTVTRGLGAGMDPNLGRASAEESQNEIRDMFKATDMVFVTCGLGGGTGTGAAPEIAKIARESGALTVGVVTRPFTFEGAQRRNIADDGYEELAANVDTIISIPNDRVLQIIDKKTSLIDAFKIVDDVLRQGVQGISEIITTPGLINVDFADVKSIMFDRGTALMGIGRGSGENRAVTAAKEAIASPLLEVSVDGARGILFTVAGSPDLSMQEVNEAAKVITENTDEDAKVIFGAIIDDRLKDEIKITVVATGFDDRRPARVEQPQIDRSMFSPSKNLFAQGGVAAPTNGFGARPTTTPAVQQETAQPTFQRKSFSDTEQEAPAPAPSSKKSSKKPKRKSVDEVDTGADEELEIPAFIRRKMGG